MSYPESGTRLTKVEMQSVYDWKHPQCGEKLIEGPSGGLTTTWHCPHGGQINWALDWEHWRHCPRSIWVAL